MLVTYFPILAWVAASLFCFFYRYVRNKWAKVIEAVLVAGITATFACIMMYTISDCRPLGVDPTSYPVQLFCEDNEYNAAIALWFQTPEATVKALFHDPPGSHKDITLIVFVLIYFPISCLTYGLSVSLGIFIPSLLVGAAWGRLTASLFLSWNPEFVSTFQFQFELIFIKEVTTDILVFNRHLFILASMH